MFVLVVPIYALLNDNYWLLLSTFCSGLYKTLVTPVF